MNRAQFQNLLRVRVQLHGRVGIRGRLPRQAEPLAQQRRYAKRLKRRVLESAMKLVRELLVPKLEALTEQPAPLAVDAKEDDLGEIIDEIAVRYAEQWSRKEFSKVVRPVAVEVDQFQQKQLNKQLSAAVGEAMSLDIVGKESWVPDAVAAFTRENVALIKSIPSEFFADLEKHISRQISAGGRWEDLAATIEERYGVAESRAELIARDQVGKFNGALNQRRQEDLGIDSFIWRTMGDERVREEHQDYNGNTYKWSDAPDDGPGQAIMCRCWAEPDMSSLLE